MIPKLLVSRQARWQRKMRRAGRCIICGAVTPFRLENGRRRHYTRCPACRNRKRVKTGV